MTILSIITVVFNDSRALENTLLNFREKLSNGIEIIVVDGKSTDGTVEVIKKYESIITKWISEVDSGIYDAMNKGLKIATGKYILHINAGDRLSLDASAMLSLLTCDKDVVIGNVSYDDKKFFRPSPKLQIVKNCIHHQGAFYKRNMLLDIGGYDTRFKILADYDLNIKLIESGVSICAVNNEISICTRGGISDLPKIKNYIEEIRVRNKNYHSGCVVYLLNVATLMRFFYKYFMKKILSC